MDRKFLFVELSIDQMCSVELKKLVAKAKDNN